MSSRIADDLLRVVLAARAGSLPPRGIRDRDGAGRRLDVALRAALLCELAQAGRLTGSRGPELIPAVEVHPARRVRTGRDPILDALTRAIGDRTGWAWRRWLAQARTDRPALIAGLEATGQWTAPNPHRDAARPFTPKRAASQRYVDVDPRAAAAMLARTFTVSELVLAPADDREAVLCFLFAVCGPTMTADRVLGWDVRLSHLRAAQGARTVRAILFAARDAARGGLRRPEMPRPELRRPELRRPEVARLERVGREVARSERPRPEDPFNIARSQLWRSQPRRHT